MSVRPLDPRDVESILAIQSAAAEIAQWSRPDYARIAAPEFASAREDSATGVFVGWAAESDGKVAGFLVARRVGCDVEVLNVAVHPDVRSHGIGASLLAEMLSWSSALHSENVFLEVRASNHGALRFYERHGFRVTGRRPRYYSAPVDDALLLTLSLAITRI